MLVLLAKCSEACKLKGAVMIYSEKKYICSKTAR